MPKLTLCLVSHWTDWHQFNVETTSEPESIQRWKTGWFWKLKWRPYFIVAWRQDFQRWYIGWNFQHAWTDIFWFNINNVDVTMISRKITEIDINIDQFDNNILPSIKLRCNDIGLTFWFKSNSKLTSLWCQLPIGVVL